MLRFLFIAFVAVATAHHGAKHEGGCPETKPVENFNLTAYQGVWYEISKIPIASEGKGQCGQAEYTLDGEVVKVKNSHVINNVQWYIEGTAKFAEDANKAAKLVVSFPFGELVTQSPLQVLATDYSNYAFAYSCRYDEKTKTHTEQAWVLSRTKKLEGDAKTAIDTFLKDHPAHIDATKLTQTDFSEEACKFTSSSLMTSQVAES